MSLKKALFLAIYVFALFIPALSGAWYYNISIDATESFLFRGVKIDLNYTFYEFGRIERGVLVLELKNSTNTVVKVSPPQFDYKKFYLSPDYIFEKSLNLHPGQKIVFYTFTPPVDEEIVLRISGDTVVLPLNWAKEIYNEKKWNWFAIRVGRVSSFFFWISVILYVSNRVKNM